MKQDRPAQFTVKSAQQLIESVKDNKRRLRNIPARSIRRSEWGTGGGGQLALINTTTGPIPGRTDFTTAGVGQAVLCSTASDGAITQGKTVNVYSWVTSPSGDPQYDLEQEIYIWLEKGLDGKWWYTGEDCESTAILEASPTSGYILTTSLTLVPGTEIIWQGHPGTYLLIFSIEIDVSAVPGNQYWDANIGLWDVTDGVQIGNDLDIGGLGSAGLLYFDISRCFSVDGTVWGHTFGLGAQRTTTTGDVIMTQDSSWQMVGQL